MYDDLNSFEQKPTQKFHKNLNNFEKPQKIFKNQKPMSNTWNARRIKELGSSPVKKHLI